MNTDEHRPYLPLITTSELRTAVREFCLTERIYEGPTANAWLLSKTLLAPHRALLAYLSSYFLDHRCDVPSAHLRGSHIAKRLQLDGLTSDRCAAVLHAQNGSYSFSRVVSIDPELVWNTSQTKPTHWTINHVDMLELRVVENLAHPNANCRAHFPPHLVVLAQAATKESSLLHPTQVQPVHQTVLATYPELENSEFFQVAEQTNPIPIERDKDMTASPIGKEQQIQAAWLQRLSVALIDSLMAEPSGFNGEGRALAFIEAHLERLPYYERLGISRTQLIILILDLFTQVQHTFSTLGIERNWIKQRVEQSQEGMSFEMNKESLRPVLRKAVIECLEYATTPVAWRVDSQILIHEPVLSERIRIALSQTPANQVPDELIELLLELKLITRSNQYVLNYDVELGVSAQWTPLIAIAIDALGVSQFLQTLSSWTLRDVNDHPYMAMVNLPGRDTLQPQKNQWRLGVLFQSLPARRFRLSTTLPTPHALIATYCGSDIEGGRND